MVPVTSSREWRSYRQEREPRRVGFEVRAVDEGSASIEVRATAQLADGVGDGAMAVVPLTVTSGKSQLSVATETSGGTAQAPSAPSTPSSDLPHVSAPLPADVAGIGSDPGIPGGSCITGVWGYQHPTLGYTGVGNYQVQIWDDDSGTDDLMATVVTSGGSYSGCFTTDDEEGAGTMEVYVRFIS